MTQVHPFHPHIIICSTLYIEDDGETRLPDDTYLSKSNMSPCITNL